MLQSHVRAGSVGVESRRAALPISALLAVLLFGLLVLSGPPAAADGDDDARMGAGVGETQSSVSASAVGGIQGIDVSHWQGAIDWSAVRASGVRFAWIKATEATSFTDPRFDTNYVAAHDAGVIRGAYHFARPGASSGAAQATYFVRNGGAWSADGLTLPGALDIENNPSGPNCYGLSQSAMRSWISDFHETYRAHTGRDVVIYTSRDFWRECTGSWTGMANRSPLWIADWSSSGSPTLPNGFSVWSVWQYTAVGSVPGISGDVDRNAFNGSWDRLLALANNTA